MLLTIISPIDYSFQIYDDLFVNILVLSNNNTILFILFHKIALHLQENIKFSKSHDNTVFFEKVVRASRPDNRPRRPVYLLFHDFLKKLQKIQEFAKKSKKS